MRTILIPVAVLDAVERVNGFRAGVRTQAGGKRVLLSTAINQSGNGTARLAMFNESESIREGAINLAGSSEGDIGVAIGVDGAAGYACAVSVSRDGQDTMYLPFHAMSLPGVVLSPPRRLPGMNQISTEEKIRRDPTYWSRTRGALGEETWSSLCDLHIGVIGAGRLGASLASELSRLGVRRLTLIDPDEIENHNLGEQPVLLPLHVGVHKVDAVAAELEARNQLPDPPDVRTSRDSVTSARSIPLITSCDLIISAVDSAIARATTALVASSFLIPHLDIACEIQTRWGRQTMTADVRYANPTQSCLSCLGGLPGVVEIVDHLNGEITAPVPWNEQRDGSLRSLNLVAVALALRQIEQRARTPHLASVWIQYQDHPSNPNLISTTRTEPEELCPVCAEAGAGTLNADALRAAVKAG
jgi:hypothetical protein